MCQYTRILEQSHKQRHGQNDFQQPEAGSARFGHGRPDAPPYSLPDRFHTLLHKHPAHLTFIVALLDGLALVVFLFSLSKGDNHLGQPPVVDKEPGRDDRKAVIFCDCLELANLFLVQQQLAIATSHVVKAPWEARTKEIQ